MDLTLVTISQMVHKAQLAASQLATEGIDVEVIDLRTVVPLDRETVIDSVARTGRLLVADEDYRSYGLSGEVMAALGEALDRVSLRAPMRRVAGPDAPISYSRALEQAVIPQVNDLVAGVKAALASDFDRRPAHA